MTSGESANTFIRLAATFGDNCFVTLRSDPVRVAASLVYEADRHEPWVVIVVAVLVNVVEIAVTRKGTETARPATIMPTKTAYSTAVGPSSLVKKVRTFVIIVFIISLLLQET
jgi:hypothetical protein